MNLSLDHLMEEIEEYDRENPGFLAAVDAELIATLNNE